MKRYLPILSLFVLSLGTLSGYENASADSSMNQGDRLPPGLQSLNLSAEQQDEVKGVMNERRSMRQAMRQKTREQLAAILTPEQLQQWEQFRQDRHGKFGQDGRRCVGQPMNNLPAN